MIVYLSRDIRPFVIYCVNGKPRSSLLIESTDSIVLILILILQWTYRDSVLSSDAHLHVYPIHFLTRHAVSNGFPVTRPSLNRSFTIRHTVSLPLRRHSRTQSQLATSVKRHSVPRTWKPQDSRARRRRTFDVLNYGHNIIK